MLSLWYPIKLLNDVVNLTEEQNNSEISFFFNERITLVHKRINRLRQEERKA